MIQLPSRYKSTVSSLIWDTIKTIYYFRCLFERLHYQYLIPTISNLNQQNVQLPRRQPIFNSSFCVFVFARVCICDIVCHSMHIGLLLFFCLLSLIFVYVIVFFFIIKRNTDTQQIITRKRNELLHVCASQRTKEDFTINRHL